MIWNEQARKPKPSGGIDSFKALSPNPGNGIGAEFAFSVLEIVTFYFISSSLDCQFPAIGAVGVFCFVTGDVSDVNVVDSFISC